MSLVPRWHPTGRLSCRRVLPTCELPSFVYPLDQYRRRHRRRRRRCRPQSSRRASGGAALRGPGGEDSRVWSALLRASGSGRRGLKYSTALLLGSLTFAWFAVSFRAVPSGEQPSRA
eukprot:scaffold26291_cov57-Phaeocystis_antarctica.AAC.3